MTKRKSKLVLTRSEKEISDMRIAVTKLANIYADSLQAMGEFMDIIKPFVEVVVKKQIQRFNEEGK